ncbi:PLDc N-terminal domain-containing protein [Pontibacter chitinilyticus]|uniref:PLDc N-terminal domain-containing protein n=1 Tax=Pontibacter chitinilyticus TaxID=2674989 RepID=UPI003219FFB1
MKLLAHSPVLFWVVVLNYLLVVYCLYHLIFRSNYTLNQRLLWMVALWLVPVLGPVAYFFLRRGREV